MSIETLQDAYNKIKTTKWSFVNNFRAMISFDNGNICSELGLDKDEKVRIESGDEEVYLQDINIPALSQTPISNFINFQNFITPSAAFDAYELKAHFLDHDQMRIWKFWSALFFAQKNSYPDQCKFTVSIFKLPDYPGEEEHVVAKFYDCVLKGVSQVDFKNSTKDTQVILEVDIDIVSPKCEIFCNNLDFSNFQ